MTQDDNNAELAAWTQFACAAISGIAQRKVPPGAVVISAIVIADEMLEAWKEKRDEDI